MVTIRDIAERSGFSPATVSAVLGDKPHCYASSETKLKIKKLAAELGYRPNLMARGLKTGRTRTIGLLGASFQNEASRREIVWLDQLVSEHDYLLLSHYYRGQSRKLAVGSDALFRRGCDGIIVDAVGDETMLPLLRPYRDRTVVITHWNLPGVSDDEVVHYDFDTGMTQLMAELERLGHRHIAMICGVGIRENDSRRQVFARTRSERGLTDAPLVHIGREDEVTPEFLRRLLVEHPRLSAVVCSNDFIALRVIRSAHLLGLRVPEELSVTGFDDIDAAVLTTPTLSTVRQPHEEGLRSAVNWLVNLLDGTDLPVCHRCPSRFILRESCAPARKQEKI